MSNALAFGGNNSSIIFSAISNKVKETGQAGDHQKETGSANRGKVLFVNKFENEHLEAYFAENMPDFDIRMVDRQSLLLMAAIWEVMKVNGISPDTMPTESTTIVSGSNHSALRPSIDFLNSAIEKGALGISPMSFPNTVGNAPASRVAIWLGLRDKVICLSDGPIMSGLDAVLTALEEVNKGSHYAWACAYEDDSATIALVGRQEERLA